MTTIFDGRAFAAEKEIVLQNRVLGLKARGVYPKLASILVGEDPASQLYVNLKKKAAERIGAELDSYFLKENVKPEEVLALINSLNTDKTVQGIMVQMPLPEKFKASKLRIINSIKLEKDVDGLKDDSPFLHSTAKAIMQIIKEAKIIVRPPLKEAPCKVVVVGATGMVGRPLVKELKKEGYEVLECDINTSDLKGSTLQGDIVISCAGIPNLIKGDMIKSGAIVIDVGSPKGDVDPSAALRARFITPVPGGVGPVTISCLLENLIAIC